MVKLNERGWAKMNEKIKILAVPCEVYSRVTGYFRPVSNWNPGKQREFEERRSVKLTTIRKLYFNSRPE